MAFVIIAFVILFAVIAYFSYQQQQQRLADLQALARELNWQFAPDSDYDHDDQFPQFNLFRQGSGHYAYNTLVGELPIGDDSCPARMGDYHYETTSHDDKGAHTHHHTLSYLLVQLPYPNLPDLRIRHEGFFDAIAGAFGFDDIDFESAEFSKRFHIKSTNKKFAYDVIYPAMMEFLLASDPPTIEIDGSCCCLSGGGVWTPAEFRGRHAWAAKFFELWPRHLVADLKSR